MAHHRHRRRRTPDPATAREVYRRVLATYLEEIHAVFEHDKNRVRMSHRAFEELKRQTSTVAATPSEFHVPTFRGLWVEVDPTLPRFSLRTPQDRRRIKRARWLQERRERRELDQMVAKMNRLMEPRKPEVYVNFRYALPSLLDFNSNRWGFMTYSGA